MDKIIFLDVDGVLNKIDDSLVIQEENYIHRLNSALVENLQKVIQETGAKVVLSSTWRKIPESVAFLENTIGPIFSKTPVLRGWRGEEIKQWIVENNFTGRYVIVDDDSDMLLEQLPHFVQTDPEYGLTPTLVYRIIHRLNKGTRYE